MIKTTIVAFVAAVLSAGLLYYYRKFKRDHEILERCYRGVE